MGYTSTLEINNVTKIEYFVAKTTNGTGTKAQLNRDRIKHATGERIKKIICALSAITICFKSSLPLSITV
jgi:phosphoribosylaminoimidazole (AIR) synthetase